MQTIYFHTFGCRTNQYETELIREKLKKVGYHIVTDFADCDICVINSCTVTGEADRKCRQLIRKISRNNSKARLIVTGCYATRNSGEILKISPKIELFSNQNKKTMAETVSGCSVFPADSSLISFFEGHTRAFVKIQDGCNAKCTYCIIPKVRPGMESRPAEEILSEIKTLLQKGYKEIVLTGIRLGLYGIDIAGNAEKPDLVSLLKKIISIKGVFRIRLSSLEITEVSTDLLKLISDSEKICQHFHLPLQSGNDMILKRMGRWYDADFFSKKVLQIRKILPDAGLTTDVIAGFPGEKENHFLNTYQFIKTHFNGIHVFPFSPRPGTPAVKLKEKPAPQIVNQRVQKLLKLDKILRHEFQNRFSGDKRTVLAESKGGFTDNGIRLNIPLPFPEGEMKLFTIPQPCPTS